MVLIPKKVCELTDILDNVLINDKPRPYLGLSSIGGPCRRSLYYSFHWAHHDSISQRLQRIFSTGHFMEDFMIASLKNTGYIVSREQEEIIGAFGHVKGHIDGTVKGIPGYEDEELLVEFKTMNDANFKKLKREGVRMSKPVHYSQMQMYMSGLELKRALYFAYNKNDSHYYTEIVELDKHFVAEKERSIFNLFTDELIPERIGGGVSTWHECRFCNFKSICHNGAPIARNCRTCVHHSIEDDGRWSCALSGQDINVEEQRKGCKDWEIEPTLNGET